MLHGAAWRAPHTWVAIRSAGAFARTAAQPLQPAGMAFRRGHAAIGSTLSPPGHTHKHTRDQGICVCVSMRPPHPLTMAGVHLGAEVSALLHLDAGPAKRHIGAGRPTHRLAYRRRISS